MVTWVGWTHERVERLKTMWADGLLSATEIAKELGGFEHTDDGGRSAVLGKVHRLKLKSRPNKTVAVLSETGNTKKRSHHAKKPKQPARAPSKPPATEATLPSQPKGPVTPLHLSAAFPKAGEHGLSAAHLQALARMYY